MVEGMGAATVRDLSGRVGRLALGVVACLLAALVVNPAAPTQGANPGTNGMVVYSSDRDGNFEIYAINPDGSGDVRLTNDPGNDANPDWSPDGRKIAFTSDRGGNLDIYVMNADGSGVTQLTSDLPPTIPRRGRRTARRSPSRLTATRARPSRAASRRRRRSTS